MLNLQLQGKPSISTYTEEQRRDFEAQQRRLPFRKRKTDMSAFLVDPDETNWQDESKKPKLEPQVASTKSVPLKHVCSLSSPPPPRYACFPIVVPCFPNIRFASINATPLPNLSFADGDEVWRNMVEQDRDYPRSSNWLKKHPELDTRMRAVLLDWLMEVCELHNLQRETYYLAQEYFDRFMATQENVHRNRLQLIGISCLFLAAKREEIYPPKLYQFAFITDRACTRKEIRNMELIILKALCWRLNPLTVISWLNVYMQLANQSPPEEFLTPKYPWSMYTQITELLDICVLDIDSLQYPRRTLAAAALYHFSDLQLVEKVSGLSSIELSNCITWVVPFAMTIKATGISTLKPLKEVSIDDLHNKQTHVNALQKMEQSHKYKAYLEMQETAQFRASLNFFTVFWDPQIPHYGGLLVGPAQTSDVSFEQNTSINLLSDSNVTLPQSEKKPHDVSIGN
ncbi:G1/S-specific cyclin-E1 [Pelobates fuscus]|uniref:G1/S-specific cyclin-E1 n=1 Tax=Pelobates fuscus TaxID=191477 RepID=UPI002FE4EC2F